MQELRGKRVLVLGLGVSGRSAARFCARCGARVVAADEATPPEPAELPVGVEVRSGGPFPDPADFDLVVPSPGIPPRRYKGRARRVWGDIELAARALQVPLVAVSGTNGKSTTTLLLEAMLRAAGLRAEAAGNLGRPALDLVGRPLDVAILEVSSFQLESVEQFRPRVAVLLNLSPDHLDRHGSLERYRQAKLRLLARQGPEDLAILNGDEPWMRELGGQLASRVWWFREAGEARPGACFDGEAILLHEPRKQTRLAVAGLAPGLAAFRGNLLAALLAARAVGADPRRALGALAGFSPPPHRAEPVLERDQVLWIDDSKATNPGAAQATLQHLRRPVIWIAGGRDKGLSFDSLCRTALGGTRAALLIGECAQRIAEAIAGRVPVVEQSGNLEKAVERARALAQPGDVVLLSPACASFDQFASFAERGARFRSLVEARA